MPTTILIINGPNLNLVGTREPALYGHQSMDEYMKELRAAYISVHIDYFQSNIEGELIDQLQAAEADGIILNAGAYTHTSIAIADAVASITIPVLELHISNILAREDYRRTSYIAEKCIGSISGLGLMGYELGLTYFLKKLKA